MSRAATPSAQPWLIETEDRIGTELDDEAENRRGRRSLVTRERPSTPS
jgi:hypothetical protein